MTVMSTDLYYLLLKFYILLSAFSLSAPAETIDFEGLPDLSLVDTQYGALGVTFHNALALTAGISLNEFDYPPNSGVVAIGENNPDAGPLAIAFSPPVSNVQFFSTYLEPILIDAYSKEGLLLGHIESPNPPNLGGSNQLKLPFFMIHYLQISSTAPLFFTLDDLQFTRETSVPDKGSMITMLGTALLCLAGTFGRQIRPTSNMPLYLNFRVPNGNKHEIHEMPLI